MKTRKVAFMKLGIPFFSRADFDELVRTNGMPHDVEWHDVLDEGVAYFVEIKEVN